MEEITAKISGLVFSNRQTGYCVLKTTPEGRSDTVIVRGSFPGIQIQIGLKAKFSGQYEEDPKYGRRFAAQNCEILPEKGRHGVVMYLSANVPSIGMITAHKLYELFGDDLVEILNNDPEKIRTVDFLQSRQADAIIKEWSQASENRTTAIFLTDLGLNAFQVRNVVTKFGVGDAVRNKIKQDPYCLYECTGVGFPSADTAARKLGVDADDPRRVRAILVYALTELSQTEGHVYATSRQIFDWISHKLFRRSLISPFSHGDYMSESHFYAALTELRQSGSIISDDGRNYLVQQWKYESESAACISDFICQSPADLGDLSQTLTEFEQERKLQLSDEQKEAFLLLNRSRICVVSGYPGTGKTLLISAFVHLFELHHLHYILLSPTGIAAKRLSQVTGKTASTIHRALGYGRDGTWDFNRGNKYHCDAVIVDEMSMVDSSTFYNLVSALSPDTILILVGDSNQLPSVGAGDVLKNLMDCDAVPSLTLTRIYRQEKASDIIKVAHQILAGSRIDTSFRKTSDFLVFDYPKDRVMNEILSISSMLKAHSESTPGSPATFQVIAPTYAGDLGVDKLNLELRGVLNPEYIAKRAASFKHGEVSFFEGDRVMVVKNDYDRMIFNGDVGKIHRISTKDDEVEVKIFNWFDQESPVPVYMDKMFTFKIEESRQVLRVAYACSVHRCQGQEFDFVILPMTSQYGLMLYRKLIYTAITRAKKKVFIFGDPEALHYAVTNLRDLGRNSHLNQLIRANAPQDSSDFLSAVNS